MVVWYEGDTLIVITRLDQKIGNSKYSSKPEGLQYNSPG